MVIKCEAWQKIKKRGIDWKNETDIVPITYNEIESKGKGNDYPPPLYPKMASHRLSVFLKRSAFRESPLSDLKEKCPDSAHIQVGVKLSYGDTYAMVEILYI